MTTITFFYKNDACCGFSVKGHSGYAHEGSDIVCSAISSCTEMIGFGIEKVFGEARGSLTVDEKTTEISFKIPEDISETENDKWKLLVGMYFSYMTELENSYNKYIKIEKRRI
jgi:uncharacterized protein YsxB (DUF464 family)